MASNTSNCPNPECGRPVAYWFVHCRCGHFVGFPNFRAAEVERDALTSRYESAKKEAVSRSVSPLFTKLEALAGQARPVISMSYATCDDILRTDKYRNYDQRVDSGERQPAAAVNHSDRAIVGEKLYPTYSHNIVYAVFSPDGRGLSSYGPVSVRWEVTPDYLLPRISLLEDNSFTFFERHSLGQRGASIPSGYRAGWVDRAKLVAAKLVSKLTPALAENLLPSLLLKVGGPRDAEEFLEIAIYTDTGLDTEDVDRVTVQRVATTADDQHRLDLVREVCANRGIEFLSE